jgi:SAM-dependent methyltransferase
MSHATVKFQLPGKGALAAGPVDPLAYYYKPVVGSLYRARLDTALALLQPPYERILELGYGSGILMPTLASLGGRVHGLDLEAEPSEVSPRLARLGVQAELVKGDASRLPFPDEHFDLVVAMSIFEHIAELGPVIASVRRVLKPGGHLLVGMPRVDRLMEGLFPLIGFKGINDHHVTTYRQFLRAAHGELELSKLKLMPGWAPAWAGLYYGMLLRRPVDSLGVD